MTSMNLNMYPSTEGHTFPPGAQRIWSHTDYEALTLLFQKPGDECYTCTFPSLGLLHVVIVVKTWGVETCVYGVKTCVENCFSANLGENLASEPT